MPKQVAKKGNKKEEANQNQNQQIYSLMMEHTMIPFIHVKSMRSLNTNAAKDSPTATGTRQELDVGTANTVCRNVSSSNYLKSNTSHG